MSCASRKKAKRKTRKPLHLIKGTLLLKKLIPAIDSVGEVAKEASKTVQMLVYSFDMQYQLLNLEYKRRDDDEDLFKYINMFLIKESKAIDKLHNFAL